MEFAHDRAQIGEGYDTLLNTDLKREGAQLARYPELIVLGGPFGRIHPFVGAGLEHELDRRALPAPRGLVRVVPAMLGVDAPLLGAAELAFEPLIADPAGWLSPRRRPLELAGA